MYLSDYSQNAARAQQARRRIRYLGTTPNGNKLWTPKEDELCQEYGSDYAVLAKKLPHRSYFALRSRCQKLGLRPRNNTVTARELSLMRRIVPTGTKEEILAAFPNRTLSDVGQICRYRGIYRKKRRFKQTGYPLLDQLREQCFKLNLSMADIDEIAKTKRYFQRPGWADHKVLNYGNVCKAIIALDGEISVRWRDE
ncbi:MULTISPECIES: SANT/Myb-like DNA-binding domain-containing protein [Brucella]|uniref:SANT/Myb domain-containing protein n=3 Tax=Brucella melitensis TaxID=29459 RepID=Q8YF39_BRUME|nr:MULTISPECIES: SANT/Myb-like DNA-binding domain-containing protein [Brucella]AAL52869.1 hypothetical protein BMEI1688 [Brucella melitensis bv. 1 str. 16M]AIJ84867.1 myb-like DNA-binding domain protein [Brucella melitensis bv. 3 str. Ether]AIJ88908.1 myb-like DNA-binding domain protein [Brucella melitensis bv. 1 str. 16M]AIJ95406.1 myb-like DNA-binding domain protein [Brucella melitensis bv. 2 str. 63/9]ALM33713.1 hypothetical protein BME20236_I0253 [Brucella melitensis]